MYVAFRMPSGATNMTKLCGAQKSKLERTSLKISLSDFLRCPKEHLKFFSHLNIRSHKFYRHNSFQLVQCILYNIHSYIHSYYKPNKKIHQIIYIQTSHYIILWCILLAKWGKKSTADNKNSCLEISKHVTTIHIASIQTNHYKYIIPQIQKTQIFHSLTHL
jgi:hypothetical protein